MEIDVPVREPEASQSDAPESAAPESAQHEEGGNGSESGAEASDDGGKPARGKLGPGEEKDDDTLRRELTALLFASPEPLSQGRLVELLERPAPARVQAALEALQAQFEGSGLPLLLQRVAGAWRILSAPEMGDAVRRLVSEPKPERISAAALETLAIVAYRQPVSKAEIEAIRGVQAGPVLRSLVDRGLVRIAGRAELPGQPLLYGTTKDFLDRFGLGALKDLPRDAELNEE